MPLLALSSALFQLVSWNKLHCDSSIRSPLQLSSDTVLYMYQEVLTTGKLDCYTNFSATAGPVRHLTFAGDTKRLFFCTVSNETLPSWTVCYVNRIHLCVFFDGNSPSCWESSDHTMTRAERVIGILWWGSCVRSAWCGRGPPFPGQWPVPQPGRSPWCVPRGFWI